MWKLGGATDEKQQQSADGLAAALGRQTGDSLLYAPSTIAVRVSGHTCRDQEAHLYYVPLGVLICQVWDVHTSWHPHDLMTDLPLDMDL